MRPTPEEVRELATAAIKDNERTGKPLFHRVVAAINAGADMVRDRVDDLTPLVRHLEDQISKGQFLNAAAVAGEIQTLMLRRLSAALKGRSL